MRGLPAAVGRHIVAFAGGEIALRATSRACHDDFMQVPRVVLGLLDRDGRAAVLGSPEGALAAPHRGPRGFRTCGPVRPERCAADRIANNVALRTFHECPGCGELAHHHVLDPGALCRLALRHRIRSREPGEHDIRRARNERDVARGVEEALRGVRARIAVQIGAEQRATRERRDAATKELRRLLVRRHRIRRVLGNEIR